MKAIIFDCFGVLAESGWGLIDDRLQPSEDQWQQMSAVSHACDRGIISMGDLQQRFSEILGVPASEVAGIIDSQRKNFPLVGFIEEKLKPSYKIGLLSNVGSGFIEHYFNAKELGLFDQFILSADEGVAKPDPRIYHLAAERLDVDVEDCLFIDDSYLNVRAAEELGMPAHLYTSLDELQRFLTDANVQLAS